LPLLLSPSPQFITYALQALTPVMDPGVGGVEPSATALLNAVTSAMRWEAGIAYPDLLAVGAERWLVWAASNVRDRTVFPHRILPDAPTLAIAHHRQMKSPLHFYWDKRHISPD